MILEPSEPCSIVFRDKIMYENDMVGFSINGTVIVSNEVRKPANYSTKFYLCRCNCGNIRWVDWKSLQKSKGSCQKCCNITHGITHTKLYNTWKCMNGRCHDKKHINYDKYGLQGITVCDEWKNDLCIFKEWAMKNGYEDGLTIDRIDNNKGYYPENCRFCTKSQQMMNRRAILNRKGKRCASQYKGVTLLLKNKKRWAANVSCMGKTTYVGSYYTEIEAAIAYNKKALELHGEYAVLNDIPDSDKE